VSEAQEENKKKPKREMKRRSVTKNTICSKQESRYSCNEIFTAFLKTNQIITPTIQSVSY